MTSKMKLQKRLSQYWKLELLNMVLVPAIMIFMSISFEYDLSLATYFTMIPVCGLLYVGGIYWRAKYNALEIGVAAVSKVMPLIARAQIPMACLTLGAVLVTAAFWISPDMAASVGDRWTATAAAALAAAEYVNYYHRQLQHFDHKADFVRLFTGRGFRRAQLAKDLATWRRSQASP